MIQRERATMISNHHMPMIRWLRIARAHDEAISAETVSTFRTSRAMPSCSHVHTQSYFGINASRLACRLLQFVPVARPACAVHAARSYLLAAMRRFAMGPAIITVEHKKKLIEVAHAGTLETELRDAIQYTNSITENQGCMIACGSAASVLMPKDITNKLSEDGNQYVPDEVKFGGVLGWLDLDDRTKPMSEMDIGRMRWACEVLDETRKFSKALGDIVVRADITSTDAWQAGMLRRVDVDASIDVVCLSIYWHKPQNDADEHPLNNLCRDLVFSAQRVGQGIELDIERFKRRVDEDKKKDVMGQSAWRYALDMLAMVKAA